MQYINEPMGLTKTNNYTERQNRLAALAKAVGHPARIAIIDYLLKTDNCICNDIVNELPLAQPTVSQHLKELKTAGIIRGTIEGNAICYCIDKKSVHNLKTCLDDILTQLENKNNHCC